MYVYTVLAGASVHLFYLRSLPAKWPAWFAGKMALKILSLLLAVGVSAYASTDCEGSGLGSEQCAVASSAARQALAPFLKQVRKCSEKVATVGNALCHFLRDNTNDAER